MQDCRRGRGAGGWQRKVVAVGKVMMVDDDDAQMGVTFGRFLFLLGNSIL